MARHLQMLMNSTMGRLLARRIRLEFVAEPQAVCVAAGGVPHVLLAPGCGRGKLAPCKRCRSGAGVSAEHAAGVSRALPDQVACLVWQLEWFKRQLFGARKARGCGYSRMRSNGPSSMCWPCPTSTHRANSLWCCEPQSDADIAVRLGPPQSGKTRSTPHRRSERGKIRIRVLLAGVREPTDVCFQYLTSCDGTRAYAALGRREIFESEASDSEGSHERLLGRAARYAPERESRDRMLTGEIK